MVVRTRDEILGVMPSKMHKLRPHTAGQVDKHIGTPSVAIFAGKAATVMEAEGQMRDYSELAKALFVRIERVCRQELEKLFVMKMQHLFVRAPSEGDEYPVRPISDADVLERSEAIYQGKQLTNYFQGVLGKILLDFGQFSDAILTYAAEEEQNFQAYRNLEATIARKYYAQTLEIIRKFQEKLVSERMMDPSSVKVDAVAAAQSANKYLKENGVALPHGAEELMRDHGKGGDHGKYVEGSKEMVKHVSTFPVPGQNSLDVLHSPRGPPGVGGASNRKGAKTAKTAKIDSEKEDSDYDGERAKAAKRVSDRKGYKERQERKETASGGVKNLRSYTSFGGLYGRNNSDDELDGFEETLMSIFLQDDDIDRTKQWRNRRDDSAAEQREQQSEEERRQREIEQAEKRRDKELKKHMTRINIVAVNELFANTVYESFSSLIVKLDSEFANSADQVCGVDFLQGRTQQAEEMEKSEFSGLIDSRFKIQHPARAMALVKHLEELRATNLALEKKNMVLQERFQHARRGYLREQMMWQDRWSKVRDLVPDHILTEGDVQIYEDGLYSDEGKIHAMYKQKLMEVEDKFRSDLNSSRTIQRSLETEVARLKEELEGMAAFMKGGKRGSSSADVGTWVDKDELGFNCVSIQAPDDFCDPCECHVVCKICNFGEKKMEGAGENSLDMDKLRRQRTTLKSRMSVGNLNFESIQIGDIVTRGLDWQHLREDGKAGNRGTVVGKDKNGKIQVEWGECEVETNQAEIADDLDDADLEALCDLLIALGLPECRDLYQMQGYTGDDLLKEAEKRKLNVAGLKPFGVEKTNGKWIIHPFMVVYEKAKLENLSRDSTTLCGGKVENLELVFSSPKYTKEELLLKYGLIQKTPDKELHVWNRVDKPTRRLKAQISTDLTMDADLMRFELAVLERCVEVQTDRFGHCEKTDTLDDRKSEIDIPPELGRKKSIHEVENLQVIDPEDFKVIDAELEKLGEVINTDLANFLKNEKSISTQTMTILNEETAKKGAWIDKMTGDCETLMAVRPSRPEPADIVAKVDPDSDPASNLVPINPTTSAPNNSLIDPSKSKPAQFSDGSGQGSPHGSPHRKQLRGQGYLSSRSVSPSDRSPSSPSRSPRPRGPPLNDPMTMVSRWSIDFSGKQGMLESLLNQGYALDEPLSKTQLKKLFAKSHFPLGRNDFSTLVQLGRDQMKIENSIDVREPTSVRITDIFNGLHRVLFGERKGEPPSGNRPMSPDRGHQYLSGLAERYVQDQMGVDQQQVGLRGVASTRADSGSRSKSASSTMFPPTDGETSRPSTAHHKPRGNYGGGFVAVPPNAREFRDRRDDEGYVMMDGFDLNKTRLNPGGTLGGASRQGGNNFKEVMDMYKQPQSSNGVNFASRQSPYWTINNMKNAGIYTGQMMGTGPGNKQKMKRPLSSKGMLQSPVQRESSPEEGGKRSPHHHTKSQFDLKKTPVDTSQSRNNSGSRPPFASDKWEPPETSQSVMTPARGLENRSPSPGPRRPPAQGHPGGHQQRTPSPGANLYIGSMSEEQFSAQKQRDQVVRQILTNRMDPHVTFSSPKLDIPGKKPMQNINNRPDVFQSPNVPWSPAGPTQRIHPGQTESLPALTQQGQMQEDRMKNARTPGDPHSNRNLLNGMTTSQIQNKRQQIIDGNKRERNIAQRQSAQRTLKETTAMAFQGPSNAGILAPSSSSSSLIPVKNFRPKSATTGTMKSTSITGGNNYMPDAYYERKKK